jgi:putative Holliday junction resolvase
MRVLGIDYGTKRIGIALGDTDSKIASPWSVLTVDSRLDGLRRIHDMASLERITDVVVGIPKPVSDRKLQNAQVREVRSFIEDLKAQGLTVHETDETMTSKVAAAQMQERGEKGKRDDLAAAAILQSWLDQK